MQIMHLRGSSQIQPEAMNQLYFIRPNRRRMGTNMKTQRLAIRLDDIKSKLSLGLG